MSDAIEKTQNHDTHIAIVELTSFYNVYKNVQSCIIETIKDNLKLSNEEITEKCLASVALLLALYGNETSVDTDNVDWRQVAEYYEDEIEYYLEDYKPSKKHIILEQPDITRQSFKSATEHYDKYMALAKELGINFDNSPMLPEVIEEVKQGQIYLNRIELRRWDEYHRWYRPNALKHGHKTWALVDTVFTAKTAAEVAAVKAITGKTCKTGTELHEALQDIYANS